MVNLRLPSVLAAFVATALAGLDLQMGSDDDLTSFVTRPEIKAPKFNVTTYDAARVTPGYWFIAPYAKIYQQKPANRYYEACQTGPAIYDQSGSLIWSGACDVRNQNTVDFRPWQFNGSFYMSAILNAYQYDGDPKGHGIVMDSSFNTVSKLELAADQNVINMHEFNLLDNGTKALHIVHSDTEIRSADRKVNGSESVLDMGFREVDLTTGEHTFEWWAYQSGQVQLAETMLTEGYPIALEDPPFNWFHANAVDKNADGDYLFSSRFLDTIFKISGKDGSIVWRLGGRNSSFAQDFNFSRQHDPRWLVSNESVETLSFLNNAADDNVQSANTSTAVIVDLNLDSMEATLVQSIPRPDGDLSHLRGNHQILDNGNHFICWSENSYISEHSPDGTALFEAQFAAMRFVTYRAYKGNFTTNPIDAPAAKAIRYGGSSETGVTVLWVSWNGATEIETWKFWSGDELIGHVQKTGFETMFQASGHHDAKILVEAVNSKGIVLNSTTVVVEEPVGSVNLIHSEIDARPEFSNPVLSTIRDNLGVYILFLTGTLLCFTLLLCARCCRRPASIEGNGLSEYSARTELVQSSADDRSRLLNQRDKMDMI